MDASTLQGIERRLSGLLRSRFATARAAAGTETPALMRTAGDHFPASRRDRLVGLRPQIMAYLRGLEAQRLGTQSPDLLRRERQKIFRQMFLVEAPEHP